MKSPWLYKECMWRKGVHNSIYVGAYLGQLQGGKTPFKAEHNYTVDRHN